MNECVWWGEEGEEEENDLFNLKRSRSSEQNKWNLFVCSTEFDSQFTAYVRGTHYIISIGSSPTRSAILIIWFKVNVDFGWFFFWFNLSGPSMGRSMDRYRWTVPCMAFSIDWSPPLNSNKFSLRISKVFDSSTSDSFGQIISLSPSFRGVRMRARVYVMCMCPRIRDTPSRRAAPRRELTSSI